MLGMLLCRAHLPTIPFCHSSLLPPLFVTAGDFALSRESLLTTLELAKTSNATEHIEMVERSLAELEQREKEHAATKKSSSWW